MGGGPFCSSCIRISQPMLDILAAVLCGDVSAVKPFQASPSDQSPIGPTISMAWFYFSPNLLPPADSDITHAPVSPSANGAVACGAIALQDHQSSDPIIRPVTSRNKGRCSPPIIMLPALP